MFNIECGHHLTEARGEKKPLSLLFLFLFVLAPIFHSSEALGICFAPKQTSIRNISTLSSLEKEFVCLFFGENKQTRSIFHTALLSNERKGKLLVARG